MREKECGQCGCGGVGVAQGLGSQRGRTLLIVLALVLVVAGVGIFFKERSRAAEKAERQGGVVVQRAVAEPDARAAAKRERAGLEAQARQAEKEQEDVLVKSLKQFDDVMLRWDDASRIAGSTSRVALAQPVAVLQALHREASQLQAPPCLAQGKDAMVGGMRESVDAYLAFMLNSDKMGAFSAQSHFEAAAPLFLKYYDLRKTCPNPA